MTTIKGEFNRLYEELRSSTQGGPFAPKAGRLLGLATRVYEDWRAKVPPDEFAGALFWALFAAFRRYDPGKYKGKLSHEEHFLNFFRTHFKGELRKAAGRRKRPTGRRRPPVGLAARGGLSQLGRLAVREAVDRLPGPERGAVHARYFLAMTNEEAAAWLGVAPTTVQHRVRRALERLKKMLGDAGFR